MTLGPDEPLSVAVRTGSRGAHTAAESTPFLQALVSGAAGPADYRRYLLALQVVYRALEAHLRAQRSHPAVAAVWDPALERALSLEADLGWWPGDEDHPVRSPALEAYVERLGEAAAQPELLVAHHYTRYLGDLAGGQAIARALRQAYRLAGEGLAFYSFPEVRSVVGYRQAYRARLDALPLTSGQRQRVVEEVRTAFALNTAVFTELGDPDRPRVSPVGVPAGSR